MTLLFCTCIRLIDGAPAQHEGTVCAVARCSTLICGDLLRAAEGSAPQAICSHLTWLFACCPALSQVFGRFVVCKDRGVMEAVAASGAPVDAITLEGDVMRRTGTISGGYINTARSKIHTHKRVSELLVPAGVPQEGTYCGVCAVAVC